MHLGDWIGVAGLFVSIVGFGVAIWQLVKTANASIATLDATRETERRIKDNHLLVLLPQFRALETELDHAVDKKDKELTRRMLKSYADYATGLAENLKGQDQVDETLIGKLDTFARQASLAKAAVYEAPPGRDFKELTKDVRGRLSELSVEIERLSARLQFSSH